MTARATKPGRYLWRYVSRKGLKPLPKTSVSQWADTYRIISQGNAEPGRWRTSRAEYQREIMDAFTQPGIHRVVVKSAAQIGKALDINTPIPTPDGWKTMGDLQEGDAIFDQNGEICRVTAATVVMHGRPCYEITFSDGSKLVADENHKWSVQTDGRRGTKNHVLTTGEMLPNYKNGNRNTYAIPVANALNMGKVELPLDPYTLGVWLGDGNSASAQITLPDYDLSIADRIAAAGHEVVVRCKDKKHPHVKNIAIDQFHRDNTICRRGHDKRITGYTKKGRCAECARQISLRNKWKGIKDFPVDPIVHTQCTMRSVLASMEEINNKHIPQAYLRAGTAQRWALLQGIMDTDGHATKKGICEITLKSKRLIEGVSELLHTLGVKHTLKEHFAVCTNSPSKASFTVWRISFTAYADMPVFSLYRKQERLKAREGRRASETERRRIINIRPVQSRPVKCITVDSASHLYLAGKAMIPTHNSDIMNNVIGRFAHLDPAPIMMIQPTIDMAQDYSKSRIAPMLRDTKVLNNLFHNVKDKEEGGTAKTRDANNTILSKIFPGGRLIMCGSNSPAGLASRPVRVLLADEVDRFQASAGTEGDPVDLASKRMTTFWNHVSGLFSTPTTEGASRIETEYLAGTQEEWQHECPNCGEYHVLRHTDMECLDLQESVDKDGHKTYLISKVLWRCPDCGFKYGERQMKDAPQKYVMQNELALENGIRSFFINAFSSPWLTWTTVMKEWYVARGDPMREQVVVNTRFGETYHLIGAYDDETQFMRRREQYDAELPQGVLALTAAVDVQGNRLEYEICGWGFGEECWGIQKGVIPGNPDHPKVWQLLDGILDRPYHFADGSSLKIIRTYIDTGGLSTQSVYEYCKKNLYKQRIGIKGDNKPGVPLVAKTSKDRKGYNLPLQFLGVNDGKQQVMTRLGIEKPGQFYFHFPLDDKHMGNRGYDQLYFKGIISEQRKTVFRGGVAQIIWRPIKRDIRNEPLDLRVYNLACWKSAQKYVNLVQRAEDFGLEVPEYAKPKKKPQAKKTTRKSKGVARAKSRSINLY